MAELKCDLRNGLNMKITTSSVFVLALLVMCFIGSQVVLKAELPVLKTIPMTSQDSVIKATQVARRQHLQKVCRELSGNVTADQQLKSLRNTFHHILVDDKHKVMYCYVPKTGCTEWKLQLMVLSGQNSTPSGYLHGENLLQKYGLRFLKTYKPEDMILRLNTYYKFMFARHPLTRLVSAFRDKFTGKWDGFFIYVPKMLKYNRNISANITAKEVPKYNFTFTEFLRYTFESKDLGYRHNEHWNNLESLCSPCFMNYDFIGKLETFNQDTRYLIKHVFKENISKLDMPNWTGTDGFLTKKYFSVVPEKLKKTVLSEYVRDAELFVYNMDGF